MDSQRRHPEATGELTSLLNDLIVAAKIISAEVNMAGLADILGQSGQINIQGEQGAEARRLRQPDHQAAHGAVRPRLRHGLGGG